jgi:hypothetical protein
VGKATESSLLQVKNLGQEGDGKSQETKYCFLIARVGTAEPVAREKTDSREAKVPEVEMPQNIEMQRWVSCRFAVT